MNKLSKRVIQPKVPKPPTVQKEPSLLLPPPGAPPWAVNADVSSVVYTPTSLSSPGTLDYRYLCINLYKINVSILVVLVLVLHQVLIRHHILEIGMLHNILLTVYYDSIEWVINKQR